MLRVATRSASRAVRRSAGSRGLQSRAGLGGARTAVVCTQQSHSSGAWRGLAVAAALAVVAASDNHTPAQNQSTKRYSRNIRASYDLLEKTVGTGGFGHVVAGVHKETGEHVAVKFINKQACSKNRVQSEVDILRTAGEHANIVSFYGFYEDDDNYYLVMEMARGGELFDQLVQYGAYSEKEARAVLKAIVDALSYLHQQRIVHLDLKPENIMLTVPVNRKEVGVELRTDIGSLIRLVDFGSASRLDGKHGVVKYGSGTVAYSPPELLKGRPADDKADIWALGIIMFIMLRGFHPFDPFNDASDEVVEQRIIDNEFPLRAFTWDNLSKPAKNVLTRMLDPDPAKRPTALELLNDEWFLSEALSTELLEDTAENLRIFHRGRRRLKAILLALMADLLPSDVHRRPKTLGSRRAAIRWLDFDNKQYVTAHDLVRACRLLGEGASERDKKELASSIRRRQTVAFDQDAEEMMQAANGLPSKHRKVIRYQDLMHLLPPLCPGRIVQQGEFLYNVKDDDGFFYLLKEGSMSLLVPAANGRDHKPDEPVPLVPAVDVSKNDHFGQLELLETVSEDRSRNHAAKCTSHRCEVYEIAPADFSLLTDVFAPVANRLAAKAEKTAQRLTLVHLKSSREYKMVEVDHPMTAQEIRQQTFPDEPVLLYVVDGSLHVQGAVQAADLPVTLTAGRFIALHDDGKPLNLSSDCPSMVQPKANDRIVPSNGGTSVDTMLLAVPLRHARELLESPAMHAIRQNLPS